MKLCGRELEENIKEIVLAVNSYKGIRVIDFSDGENKRPIWIFFIADSLEALPPLLYDLDICHNGIRGWQAIARTDCAMSPTTFMIESTSIGQKAWDESKKIAHIMTENQKENTND